PGQDPAVFDREIGTDTRQRPHRLLADARQREAPRVPDLVREVASVRERPLDVLVVERDVGTDGALADDRVAHRVRPEPLHDLEGNEAVAQRLRTLPAL